MPFNKKIDSEAPLELLTEEMTYQSYLMKNFSSRMINALSVPAYIMLSMANKSGSAYLKDIASELKLTMAQVSKIAGTLRDKGFVRWTHDGDGQDGTYIAPTALGKDALARREAKAKNFYANVIEKFGKENFVQLLNMLGELEDVMEETERSQT